MGLHISLQPSLRQEQRQELRQEQLQSLIQALEQQMKLVQILQQHSISLLDSGPNPPRRVLDSVVQQMLSRLPEEYRKPLGYLFEDARFCDLVVQNCDGLSVPTVNRVRELIVRHFHTKEDGRVRIEVPSAESGAPAIVSEEKVDLATLQLAFRYAPDPEGKNRDSVESQASELIAIYRSQAASAEAGGGPIDMSGALHRIRELQVARLWRDSNLSVVQAGTKLVIFALGQKDDEGQPLLGGMLRELAILKRLQFVLSERLQNRFVSRCQSIARQDPPERFERSFCNVVGEYVLSCMGVVHPDLFTLQSGKITEREERLCRESLAEIGVDYEKLRDHYGLKGAGTLVWNRWSVVGMRPTRLTDELIRTFIGTHIGSEREAILAAADYPRLHQRIVETRERFRGVKEPQAQEEQAQALREILVDTLTQQKFTEVILQLIKDRWYPALHLFFDAQASRPSSVNDGRRAAV